MSDVNLSVLDIIALAIILVSAGLAFFRGFVHEILSITAWAGASLAALYGLPYLQPKAREIISITWAADGAAALAIFLVVLLALSLVTHAIAKRVQESSLGSLDRSLGVLFGIARGVLVVLISFIVLTWVFPPEVVKDKKTGVEHDTRPDWILTTRSLPYMEQGAEILRNMVPEELLENEDEAKKKAAEAKRQTDEAIELKKTYDRLTQPPAGPEKEAEKAAPEGKDEPGKAPSPSYNDKDRQTLDRLIERQQNP